MKEMLKEVCFYIPVSFVLVYDRTSTISYSMFFKAILKFQFLSNLNFWLVLVVF